MGSFESRIKTIVQNRAKETIANRHKLEPTPARIKKVTQEIMKQMAIDFCDMNGALNVSNLETTISRVLRSIEDTGNSSG